IKPDNLMVDIEHRIRGEKKDPYSEKWVPRIVGAKAISEELIGNFMSFLGAYLNNNTSMSNFCNDEINNIMCSIIEYVAEDLTVNAGTYDIKGNYTEMTRSWYLSIIKL
ncbi:unnamed protein product, partial [marine sediment metagenome]